MWLDHVVAQRTARTGMSIISALARAVVGHRERAVLVACWPSTIYGCSYELSIGLTTSLITIDGDCC